MKPLAFRGELCLPSQGQQVTFVNPRAWFDTWQAIDPQLALQHMARRYLHAYGPATPDDFAFWWGRVRKALPRKLFQSIADELEEVDVEGWRAVALRTTFAPMQSLEPAETIHMLPLFDAYTIGIPRDLEPVLAKMHKVGSSVRRGGSALSSSVRYCDYCSASSPTGGRDVPWCKRLSDGPDQQRIRSNESPEQLPFDCAVSNQIVSPSFFECRSSG